MPKKTRRTQLERSTERERRILALANEAIGDRSRARLWLTEANAALGGRRPLDLLDSDLGARQVERVLGRINHGVYE